MAETHHTGWPAPLAESYVRVLETLCGQSDLQAAADALVAEVSAATGCESVALRVHDRKDDYPYLAHVGFSPEFISAEAHLCARAPGGGLERDRDGSSVLACMCGSVLSGTAAGCTGLLTPLGSFWTNSTTDLAAATDLSDACTHLRGTCMKAGYESVALVPLKSGARIVGLVQANSRRRGLFTPEVVAYLERLAGHTGSAIEAAWRRQELARLSSEFEEHRRGVETMVALGEMAATLAHEIKNPLAGMMLSATRLRKALKGQERLEAVAEHLCAGIDALSQTVTRVGRTVREPRLERTPADVNQVLETAMTFAAPRAVEQGVRVVRNLAEGLPPLTADTHYLMRAFLNLIVNGLDVMPSGGVLTLTTSLLPTGNIQIVIGDLGPGVRGDVPIEALFRPFETTKPGGTGLGLGIVRRIVDLHSGTVTLRPGRAGGTEAVIVLNPAGERVAREAAAP
jgi:signal transduction histidine kinase